jgi:hypothetical protein
MLAEEHPALRPSIHAAGAISAGIGSDTPHDDGMPIAVWRVFAAIKIRRTHRVTVHTLYL